MISANNIGVPAPSTQPAPLVYTPRTPGISGPRTIVSVYPKALSLELRHEGFKVYTIEAAKRGKFSTLLVRDTYAWNKNLHTERFELYQALVPATSVVENLMQRWTQGMVGTRDGLGPGLMICEGFEPTEAEVATISARQEAYFRGLILEADALEIREPYDITDMHRLAADWMGAQDRKWFKPISHIELVPCIACGESIRSIAKICRFCQTDLRKFAVEEAAFTAQVQEAEALLANDKPLDFKATKKV